MFIYLRVPLFFTAAAAAGTSATVAPTVRPSLVTLPLTRDCNRTSDAGRARLVPEARRRMATEEPPVGPFGSWQLMWRVRWFYLGRIPNAAGGI